MKKPIRIFAFMLLLCIFLSAVPAIPAQAANPATVYQLNTYKNTGNQRQDLIGVALTQVGYREKYNNDTYYGDWFGLSDNEWCGIFVSWCARQAEIPESVIRQNGLANPNSFGIPYYSGSSYTPKPGDLFFTSTFSHVGIVWYVEGEYFYTIEGNTNPDGYYDPNDYTYNSYFVASRKRTIRNCYFGVPNYTSDDTHNYVRKIEPQHPHKVYYECSSCDDKYYTSYTDYLSGCYDCLSCGCDDAYAGWYIVAGNYECHYLRWSHAGSQSSYAVAQGSVVYVYGADESKDTAYIEFYGRRGHIPLSCLQAYPYAPEAPHFTMTQTNWFPGQVAQLQWDTPEGTELFRMQLYKDGVLYEEKQLTTAEYQPLLPEGSYEIRLTADNRAGQSPVSAAFFTIRELCYIATDLQDGNDPKVYDHTPAEPFTLPAPTREGYTLLGWTDVADSSIALYTPGTVLNISRDMTFYAVWTANTSHAKELIIQTPFTTNLYMVGEEFSEDGLVLDYMYSDGAGLRITEGFTVEGFDSETPGEQTITISYDDLSVTYTVKVIDYIPGDMDANKTVDLEDVMALLWHVNFSDLFQIHAPADFDHNDVVDLEDVMTLLWHVNFPNLFPLESTPTNEGA